MNHTAGKWVGNKPLSSELGKIPVDDTVPNLNNWQKKGGLGEEGRGEGRGGINITVTVKGNYIKSGMQPLTAAWKTISE